MLCFFYCHSRRIRRLKALATCWVADLEVAKVLAPASPQSKAQAANWLSLTVLERTCAGKAAGLHACIMQIRCAPQLYNQDAEGAAPPSGPCVSASAAYTANRRQAHASLIDGGYWERTKPPQHAACNADQQGKLEP